jgi:hypothetical protein
MEELYYQIPSELKRFVLEILQALRRQCVAGFLPT